jgi:hypothetical protein
VLPGALVYGSPGVVEAPPHAATMKNKASVFRIPVIKQLACSDAAA